MTASSLYLRSFSFLTLSSLLPPSNRSLARQRQFDSHDVSRVDYSFGGFDWSGGTDITKGLGGVGSNSTSSSGGGIGNEMLSSGAAGSDIKSVSSSRPLHATHSNGQPDYVQVQRVLLARSRVLGKEIQRVRRLAASTAATTTAASAATTTAATVTMTTATAASVKAEDGNGTHTTMTAASLDDNQPSMLSMPLPAVSEGTSVATMQPPQQSSTSTSTTTATAASPFPLLNGLAGQSSSSLPHSHSQSSYTPQTNGSSHASTTATITAGTPSVPVARCTDLALAQTWQEIATELLQVPESLLNQDTLTVIENNLRDAGRFFELDLGPDDQRWAEFMQLQQVPSATDGYVIVTSLLSLLSCEVA